MNTADAGETIVKEITIAASPERIFSALSDPAQRVQWWGAEGRFKTKHMESDLRVGGAWLVTGDGVGGYPFTLSGEYRVVEPPRVLEFSWRPSWQSDMTESVVRFELEPRGSATLVRITHSGLSGDAARMQHKGWPDVLAWLKGFVETNSHV
jgi:uncharacterized protein YndB with AHSA1/START domain